jgi:hypothetical protein
MEGRGWRRRRGKEHDEAGVVDRAGGHKNQQSADGGGDSQRGREDAAGN